MNTLEAIKARKSTRSYTPEQIPEDALQVILEAGFAAPVAMANYASLHITVVQNENLLGRVNDATAEMLYKLTGNRKNPDYGAKTLILVSSTPIHRVGTDHANAGIVIENMVLAATELGIDSVILGGAPAAVAQNPQLMRELGIPEGFTPLLGAFFGFGAEETPVKEHTIAVNRV